MKFLENVVPRTQSQQQSLRVKTNVIQNESQKIENERTRENNYCRVKQRKWLSREVLVKLCTVGHS